MSVVASRLVSSSSQHTHLFPFLTPSLLPHSSTSTARLTSFSCHTALQNDPQLATRDVVHSHISNIPIKLAKRDVASTEGKRDTIDAVNLNVDTSNEGVTMTFVETLDEDDVEVEDEE